MEGNIDNINTSLCPKEATKWSRRNLELDQDEGLALDNQTSCPSCRQLTKLRLLEENWDTFLVKEEVHISETYELGQLYIVKCSFCLKFLGLLENIGGFHSADEIMKTQSKEDGWQKVETVWERRVLFVLSQIIYKENEAPDEVLLMEFAFPPPTDLIKLLWANKQAVGFYSVKPKGTLDPYMMEWYTMTTLDTIFITRSHRGQGWSTLAVKDLLLEFPQENIGFQFPISLPMAKVLKKYLEASPSDRPRFWEISGCGSSGSTQNLWFKQSLIAQKQVCNKETC